MAKGENCYKWCCQPFHSNCSQISKSTWHNDPLLQTIISDLQLNSASHFKYTWHNQQLKSKGKLVIDNNAVLKDQLLKWFNDSAQGGHSGEVATIKRLSSLLYWTKLGTKVLIILIPMGNRRC